MITNIYCTYITSLTFSNSFPCPSSPAPQIASHILLRRSSRLRKTPTWLDDYIHAAPSHTYPTPAHVRNCVTTCVIQPFSAFMAHSVYVHDPSHYNEAGKLDH